MSTASQQTWTEPPWTGWIETTGDALLILEAARRGVIPRVTRRLVDSERKMITSGSVFVFDEDESGIKRWTDGFFWSPSRILGNFLLYRETDKRGPGHKGAQAQDAGDNVEAQSSESYSLSRPKTETGSQLGFDKLRERTLMGSLTNSYKFKTDGLMKKTFSLNIDGVAQHLISYYRIEDVENGRLRSPSSLPELASMDISPEYLDKTHFRNPPKVEVGPDGVPRYRGEADDVEASNSSIISAPLSTGPPLLTDGRIADNNGGSSSTSKRPPKRYEPYSTTQPSTKRHRKRNGKTPESPLSDESSRRSASQTPTPTSMHPPPLPSPYSDPNGGSTPSTSSAVIQSQPGYTGYYPVPAGYGHPQTAPVYPYLPQGPSPSSYSPPYGGNSSTAANPGPYYGVGYYPAPPYYGPTWPSYPGYQHAPLPPPPHATVTEEKNEEHESQS